MTPRVWMFVSILGKVTVHSSADAADIAAAALSPLLSPGLIASDATDGVEVSSGIDLSTARHMNQLQKQSQSYLQHLHATEDCDSLRKKPHLRCA